METDIKTPKISVVIPFYNEKDNVEELHAKLTSVLREQGQSYELIFIDDGSTDGTHAILIKLFSADQSLKIIRLRKNFGQTAALQAGFDHARGEIIVSMDGDLQHAPEDIPSKVLSSSSTNFSNASRSSTASISSLMSFMASC